VEFFEEIRREFNHGSGSVRGVAEKLCVHRRTVRQALSNAVPPAAKERGRQRPVLSELAPFIDAVLEADVQAPRKQRHTAHRIWVRVRNELGSTVAESTIRQYVRQRKDQLQLSRRETYVLQQYLPGQEGQVDWYEAHVDLGADTMAERTLVQVFSMRAMYSGAAFHIAFPHATQQAFLEAHEAAFGYFGGVFGTLRYDNLGSAVKKVLRGHQREQTARFTAFRSHWGFASEFCNPARGNEKGGVEGELGHYRRNHLVPVPRVRDWHQLNLLLLQACIADGERRIGDRTECVSALWTQERPLLLPLASEGCDLSEASWPMVDSKGCVRVKTNWYSTPLRPGTRAHVLLSASRVEIRQENRCVAVHTRCYLRQQHVLELEHYLDVLERKPGALAGSIALAQARAQGRWPACFDDLWQRLQERHGRSAGTRQLIELLLWTGSHRAGSHRTGASEPAGTVKLERLSAAVQRALQLGTVDVAAIQMLFQQGVDGGLTLLPGNGVPHSPQLQLIDLTPLQQSLYDRPLPDMGCYDRLRPSTAGSEPASRLHLIREQGRQEVA
jgi:transposase